MAQTNPNLLLHRCSTFDYSSSWFPAHPAAYRGTAAVASAPIYTAYSVPHPAPLAADLSTHPIPRSISRSPIPFDDPTIAVQWPGSPTTTTTTTTTRQRFPISTSAPSSRRSITPAVKTEPADESPGCFIMELSAPQVETTLLSQSLAPPTEVPLRATQASKKMRGMMTVFRLNPFAVHTGDGRGLPSAAYREEAGPLEEEPLIFEFQLDVDRPSSWDDSNLNNALHSFSPDFDLHTDLHGDPSSNNDGGQSPEWPSGTSDSVYSTTTPLSTTWDLEYPPSTTPTSTTVASPAPIPHPSYSRSQDSPIPSQPSTSIHQQPPRNLSRLHGSMSHPYLRKNSGICQSFSTPQPHFDDANTTYVAPFAVPSRPASSSTSPSLSAAITLDVPVDRHAFHQNPHQEAAAAVAALWNQRNYASPLRSGPLATCSTYNPTVPIPSFHRRWSLPDGNTALPGPFFP